MGLAVRQENESSRSTCENSEIAVQSRQKRKQCNSSLRGKERPTLMDSGKRSWAKSITWRLIGIVILGLITYLFTGDWKTTTAVTLIFHGIRLVLYYWHERVWEHISWGRATHPLARFAVKEHLTQENLMEISKILQDRGYISETLEYEI